LESAKRRSAWVAAEWTPSSPAEDGEDVVGYLVGTSIAVIGLYIAFGLPIYLRWRKGDQFEVGPWTVVPTQLIFVPMLFLLPLPIVPRTVRQEPFSNLVRIGHFAI